MAPSIPTLALDYALADVLALGAKKTLASLFGVTVTCLPPEFAEQSNISGDVSGIVGMVQEKSEGILIVSFQKEVIFNVLEKLYKREFHEIEFNVRDCVGEITNIIYGNMKKYLNDRGHKFKQVIPTVIVGDEHTVSTKAKSQVMVVPFNTDHGKFTVRVVQHLDIEA